MIQRLILFFLGWTLSFQIQAQIPAIKWDYGLNAQFNVNFIKPAVSDTFSNRPGLGGGLMLEASIFDKYAIQLSPSLSKTGYINDNTLKINTMTALDLAMDFVYTATKDESVVVSLGVVRAFNFAHVQKRLDGSNTSGLGSTTKLSYDPYNLGLKLGFGIKLSDGVRLNLNYLDFVDGTQRKNVIKGRVDYFQLGLQLRFNEFSNAPATLQKETNELAKVAEAETHHQLISSQATMVFVLPELKSSAIFTNSEEWQQQKVQIRTMITEAIHERYRLGSFMVIQPDQLQNLLKFGFVNIVNSDGTNATQKIESPFYIAKIGEFFLENNSSLKWGILLFDSEMEVLQAPFKAYTPYMGMDKFFQNKDGVYGMISAFNASLK